MSQSIFGNAVKNIDPELVLIEDVHKMFQKTLDELNQGLKEIGFKGKTQISMWGEKVLPISSENPDLKAGKVQSENPNFNIKTRNIFLLPAADDAQAEPVFLATFAINTKEMPGMSAIEFHGVSPQGNIGREYFTSADSRLHDAFAKSVHNAMPEALKLRLIRLYEAKELQSTESSSHPDALVR